MRNKEVYQNKISRLESMMNNIYRAVSSNDRQAAFSQIELSKEMLSDLQTMINREQTIYK